MMSAPILVVAGVLTDGDKILITQRFDNEGGLWEFPGGKVEQGESEPGALVRELWEELGIKVKVGEYLTETLHHYPAKSILLKSYRCELVEGDIALHCHQAKAWITPSESDAYTFSDADKPLVELLKNK
ncbi:CTP pyrophosphohydrolase [Grimontia celer]|uniref:8-oxo-dGTP diphosphatase n=1 Tax=Grimontia celer TaxID=1796497 RepID=A0A128EUN3_9GAMM|nr:(deoxy)nucleoside triphosphate pyrophosphohydrolase [Grimontia celer]CZF77711.1 CTP pyrophosphohydrolase [Grimontia celer]